MLTSLEIKRFRGLRDLKLDDLGRVNLLVGANNGGKTSVLEALALALTTALIRRAVRSTSATSAAEPLAAMSGAVTSTRAPGLRASRPCSRSR